MKHFPRFIYSDSKNEHSSGPVLFHLNFPRCVFKIENDSVTDTLFVIDTNIFANEIDTLKSEAENFLIEFISKDK